MPNPLIEKFSRFSGLIQLRFRSILPFFSVFCAKTSPKVLVPVATIFLIDIAPSDIQYFSWFDNIVLKNQTAIGLESMPTPMIHKTTARQQSTLIIIPVGKQSVGCPHTGEL
jgi:hypothetical protein